MLSSSEVERHTNECNYLYIYLRVCVYISIHIHTNINIYNVYFETYICISNKKKNDII